MCVHRIVPNIFAESNFRRQNSWVPPGAVICGGRRIFRAPKFTSNSPERIQYLRNIHTHSTALIGNHTSQCEIEREKQLKSAAGRDSLSCFLRSGAMICDDDMCFVVYQRRLIVALGTKKSRSRMHTSSQHPWFHSPTEKAPREPFNWLHPHLDTFYWSVSRRSHYYWALACTRSGIQVGENGIYWEIRIIH